VTQEASLREAIMEKDPAMGSKLESWHSGKRVEARNQA
jgi:hypothetical protein